MIFKGIEIVPPAIAGEVTEKPRERTVDREITAIFREAKVCRRCYGDIPLRVPTPDKKTEVEG